MDWGQAEWLVGGEWGGGIMGILIDNRGILPGIYEY